MATYIPNDRLEALARALTQIEPCAVTGRITENEIKIALGEHGDIWPASIRHHDDSYKLIILRPEGGPRGNQA